jgi:cation transport ATPase
MLKALMEGVKGEKTHLQSMADRVSAIFVPLVLAIALFTLVLWFAFLEPGNLWEAVKHSITVLVVACPCAMGLAVPMAQEVAVSTLAQSGIYLRNPRVFETLAKVDLVAFDKTGSLTIKSEGVAEGEELREAPTERLRRGAQKTVSTLQKMGISCAILSGDKKEQVETMAKEAVGVVIGRAAEVSIRQADVILTKNKITHLLKAIYVARKMVDNSRSSLFWALFYNGIGILLAIVGLLTPVVAGMAMSLSSLAVVLNVRRLKKQISRITFEKLEKI